MIKQAIEKIVELAGTQPIYNDGCVFVRDNEGGIVQLRTELDMPEVLDVNSLDALVALLRHGDPLPGLGTIYVSVKAHDRVNVFSEMRSDLRCLRCGLYSAASKDVPGWGTEVRLPFDQAAVALMTRFQESEDREYALRLLSQITTGAKVTYADNGIASTIVMQKGAALAENVTIRPLVKLRPYRTFQEVEQPEGLFLIRIQERGITFTEADGGMWKLTARKTVKAWLEKELEGLENVVVML